MKPKTQQVNLIPLFLNVMKEILIIIFWGCVISVIVYKNTQP